MEPNLRTKVLIRALRELREQAGLTQEVAGTRLRFTNRKMSRIERGQVPSYHELQAMLDVYGVPVNDWPGYERMWEKARERSWWHHYSGADRGYIGLETEASSVFVYQNELVPGLLQTRDYMREICAVAVPPPVSVDAYVTARLRRQQRLTAEEPLVLHTILKASTLQGDLPCMGDQLSHIVMVSELGNVTVQVLPDEQAWRSGVLSSFVVLGFPDDPDIAHIEHIGGSVQIEKLGDVRRCRLGFERLTALALDPEQSVALIDRMAAER